MSSHVQMKREAQQLETFGLILRLKLYQSSSEFCVCPKDEYLYQIDLSVQELTNQLSEGDEVDSETKKETARKNERTRRKHKEVLEKWRSFVLAKSPLSPLMTQEELRSNEEGEIRCSVEELRVLLDRGFLRFNVAHPVSLQERREYERREGEKERREGEGRREEKREEGEKEKEKGRAFLKALLHQNNQNSSSSSSSSSSLSSSSLSLSSSSLPSPSSPSRLVLPYHSFWLSLPQLTLLEEYMTKGRQLLVQTLKRSPFKESTFSQLEAKKTKRRAGEGKEEGIERKVRQRTSSSGITARSLRDIPLPIDFIVNDAESNGLVNVSKVGIEQVVRLR